LRSLSFDEYTALRSANGKWRYANKPSLWKQWLNQQPDWQSRVQERWRQAGWPATPTDHVVSDFVSEMNRNSVVSPVKVQLLSKMFGIMDAAVPRSVKPEEEEDEDEDLAETAEEDGDEEMDADFDDEAAPTPSTTTSKQQPPQSV
jgi:hypothetical protein